jgi:hypothetical protein
MQKLEYGKPFNPSSLWGSINIFDGLAEATHITDSEKILIAVFQEYANHIKNWTERSYNSDPAPTYKIIAQRIGWDVDKVKRVTRKLRSMEDYHLFGIDEIVTFVRKNSLSGADENL